MTETHIESAIAAIGRVCEILGDGASFRARVLLQMLLMELEADRAAAAAKVSRADADDG